MRYIMSLRAINYRRLVKDLSFTYDNSTDESVSRQIMRSNETSADTVQQTYQRILNEYASTNKRNMKNMKNKN
jgi:hypothetical protein